MLVLRTISPGGQRESAVRMLADAGRSEAYVRESCAAGTLCGLVDLAGDPAVGPVAVLVSVEIEAGRAEEIRLAAASPVVPDAGRKLIDQYADAMRAAGMTHVLAAVSDAEARLLAILQSGGFRFRYVERDGAGPDRGFHPGAGHRDLLWLDLEL